MVKYETVKTELIVYLHIYIHMSKMQSLVVISLFVWS